jgi:starch phosphorylase
VREHLRYSLGCTPGRETPQERMHALSLAVRERAVDAMHTTEERFAAAGAKRLAYLSMEFLMGRALENNLSSLGLLDEARAAMAQTGTPLEALRDLENDAALGNGGLGRLAACFLDSLATLAMPGGGYGILYEYGLFRQKIAHGEQTELPDQWNAASSPWLVERAEEACIVPVYGRIDHATDADGNYNPMWMGWRIIVGVPYDMPIVGHGGQTVNRLRLFAARASNDFDMQIFNSGDYQRAVEQKMSTETISKVLYPSDSDMAGKELRLVQEYFLVACAVRDVFRQVKRRGAPVEELSKHWAIQLNDTHPALAVAEVMRILLDEHALSWDAAWKVTCETLAYTNHTLLPEALERWPVDLMEKVLPRHVQIIFEINRRFLDAVAARFPGDTDRLRRMSIIEEGSHRQVRMAHLAIVGGHSVNGVAALHSRLVKTELVPDFNEMWPERFNNKTNGVTPRRWLLQANPRLAALIDRAIGPGWATDLDRLRSLEAHAVDAGFCDAFAAVKHANKVELAAVAKRLTRIDVDPSSIFDIQIKRIHEYKRQLLALMHVIHCYYTIVEDGKDLDHPRTFIFAGKAAPGYFIAKRIIALAHGIAAAVAREPRARAQMNVVFLPDYRVSLAERIVPAADLSEQISTAGKEASGTGNMKLALNGALTIGTLDGANVEILEEVGDDNIFIFGLTADEVTRQRPTYNPRAYYNADAALRRVVDSLAGDAFCPGSPGHFKVLHDQLMEHGDEYFHLADFKSYVEAQARASMVYRDRATWARKSLLNTARVGKFSSDRTIREYAAEIWGIRSTR